MTAGACRDARTTRDPRGIIAEHFAGSQPKGRPPRTRYEKSASATSLCQKWAWYTRRRTLSVMVTWMHLVPGPLAERGCGSGPEKSSDFLNMSKDSHAHCCQCIKITHLTGMSGCKFRISQPLKALGHPLDTWDTAHGKALE